MPWRRAEITLRFTTPAFLGDANQQAQMRTPPFKHLIRFWWRVAVAKHYDYNYQSIRKAEEDIFGTAANNTGHASKIRIKLDDEWRESNIDQAIRAGRIYHPEVHRFVNCCVDAALYLGYGPVQLRNVNTYINPGERTTLILLNDPANPVNNFPIKEVVQLIHWFGTVGGRSNNSWGSIEVEQFKLDDKPIKVLPITRQNLLSLNVLRPLNNALQLEWPHAIGQDDSPAVWLLTESSDRWEDILLKLAQCRATIRVNFQAGVQQPTERHLLGVPITHHQINLKRLGDQLRFKIFKTPENKYQAVIYHMPGKFPAPNNVNEFQVWQDVYKILDSTKRHNCHPKFNPRCHNPSCNPVNVYVRRLP